MRIDHPTPSPVTTPAGSISTTTGTTTGPAVDTTASTSRARGFSVLNDFRYLTDSDKDLLRNVTGERIEPGFTDQATPASQFALQLALDRRTGELAPNQSVTAVYLKNRAHEIDARNYGHPGLRNPYSGEVMVKAVDFLTSGGRGQTDIRL